MNLSRLCWLAVLSTMFSGLCLGRRRRRCAGRTSGTGGHTGGGGAPPDDEGALRQYLARAIYDEHKRVAVVFGTRGGSGGNDYSREHGAALAISRDGGGGEACSKLGITNVWFLTRQICHARRA